MKNKIIWIIIIILIVVAIFAKCTPNEENESNFKVSELNVGDIFDVIEYPNDMYVLNYEITDVDGDGENDVIILVGEKQSVAENGANNIDVVVYDSKDKAFIHGKMKNMSGENVKAYTSNFTNTKGKDIMIVAKNGEEQIIRIYTYEDNKLNEIFKEKNNEGIAFTGKWLDGFKVKLTNKKLNKECEIDLTNRKENYITNGFYEESGKLKNANAKVNTSKFIEVQTVQLNDRTGIRTVQKITGFNNADIIDKIETIWKYEDGKWHMKEAKGIEMGNLLY